MDQPTFVQATEIYYLATQMYPAAEPNNTTIDIRTQNYQYISIHSTGSIFILKLTLWLVFKLSICFLNTSDQKSLQMNLIASK